MATVFRLPPSQRIAPVSRSAAILSQDNGSDLLASTLRSKDKFFGAAGQGPCYDQPNPLRRPLVVHNLTWIQSLVQLLPHIIPPGEAELTNPVRRPPYRQSRDFYAEWILPIPLIAASTALPTGQPSWPNPTQREVTGLVDQQQPSLALTASPIAVPFGLDDWPNPTQRKVTGLVDQQQPSLALITPPVPRVIRQPNVQRYSPRSPWVAITTQSEQQSHFPPIPPFISGAPPPGKSGISDPVLPRPRVWDSSQSSPTILIEQQFGPVSGDSGINPVLPRSRAGVFDTTASTPLTLRPPGAIAVPFNQYDWPNPRGLRSFVPMQSDRNGALYSFAAISLPFSQDDWPNPIRPRVQIWDSTQSSPTVLVEQQFGPISGDAFPLPVWPRSRSGVFDSTSAPPLVLRNVVSSTALIGVQAAGQAGTLVPSLFVALSGVQATGTAGSVTPSDRLALGGVVGTGIAQSLILSVVATLAGVQATGAAGSIGVGTAVSVALIGVQATGTAGNVSVPISAVGVLVGVVGVGQAGIVALPPADVFVTGVEATGLAGIVSVQLDISITLVGVQAIGQAGIVSTSGSIVIILATLLLSDAPLWQLKMSEQT